MINTIGKLFLSAIVLAPLYFVGWSLPVKWWLSTVAFFSLSTILYIFRYDFTPRPKNLKMAVLYYLLGPSIFLSLIVSAASGWPNSNVSRGGFLAVAVLLALWSAFEIMNWFNEEIDNE